MKCQTTGPEFYQRFYYIVASNVFICQLYGSIHSLFLRVPLAARRIQTGSGYNVAELNINCTVKLNVACMTYPVSLHVCAVLLYIRTWISKYQLSGGHYCFVCGRSPVQIGAEGLAVWYRHEWPFSKKQISLCFCHKWKLLPTAHSEKYFKISVTLLQNFRLLFVVVTFKFLWINKQFSGTATVLE
jgi:hypothetical protein